MRDFLESDWKKLSALKSTALERYYNRILDRVQAALDRREKEDARQIYMDIFRPTKKERSFISSFFDHWSRSNATIMFMAWVNHGLVTRSEYNAFSDSLKSVITHLDEVPFYQGDGG